MTLIGLGALVAALIALWPIRHDTESVVDRIKETLGGNRE